MLRAMLVACCQVRRLGLGLLHNSLGMAAALRTADAPRTIGMKPLSSPSGRQGRPLRCSGETWSSCETPRRGDVDFSSVQSDIDELRETVLREDFAPLERQELHLQSADAAAEAFEVALRRILGDPVVV